jgi:hypothetical protein
MRCIPKSDSNLSSERERPKRVRIREERPRRERTRPERERRKTDEGNFGTDLYYPKNCTVVADDRSHIFYPESTILSELSRVNFDAWSSESWDCEDRAMWGCLNVRKALPQCPIGRADGFVAGESEYHSVIIYWTAPKERKYWDPQYKGLVNFTPRTIIA